MAHRQCERINGLEGRAEINACLKCPLPECRGGVTGVSHTIVSPTQRQRLCRKGHLVAGENARQYSQESARCRLCDNAAKRGYAKRHRCERKAYQQAYRARLAARG